MPRNRNTRKRTNALNNAGSDKSELDLNVDGKYQRTENRDLEYLRSMFSDVDAEIIEAVFIECGKDAHQAMDTLIEMCEAKAYPTPQSQNQDNENDLATIACSLLNKQVTPPNSIASASTGQLDNSIHNFKAPVRTENVNVTEPADSLTLLLQNINNEQPKTPTAISDREPQSHSTHTQSSLDPERQSGSVSKSEVNLSPKKETMASLSVYQAQNQSNTLRKQRELSHPFLGMGSEKQPFSESQYLASYFSLPSTEPTVSAEWEEFYNSMSANINDRSRALSEAPPTIDTDKVAKDDHGPSFQLPKKIMSSENEEEQKLSHNAKTTHGNSTLYLNSQISEDTNRLGEIDNLSDKLIDSKHTISNFRKDEENLSSESFSKSSEPISNSSLKNCPSDSSQRKKKDTVSRNFDQNVPTFDAGVASESNFTSGLSANAPTFVPLCISKKDPQQASSFKSHVTMPHVSAAPPQPLVAVATWSKKTKKAKKGANKLSPQSPLLPHNTDEKNRETLYLNRDESDSSGSSSRVSLSFHRGKEKLSFQSAKDPLDPLGFNDLWEDEPGDAEDPKPQRLQKKTKTGVANVSKNNYAFNKLASRKQAAVTRRGLPPWAKDLDSIKGSTPASLSKSGTIVDGSGQNKQPHSVRESNKKPDLCDASVHSSQSSDAFSDDLSVDSFPSSKSSFGLKSPEKLFSAKPSGKESRAPFQNSGIFQSIPKLMKNTTSNPQLLQPQNSLNPQRDPNFFLSHFMEERKPSASLPLQGPSSASLKMDIFKNRLVFRGVKSPAGVVRRYILEKQPVMVILRGLPGSGKTHLAK
ncbi:hypothetical protein PoB_000159200 [Plakobranchus ocellatus]|uniref:CUE domain-containing protein n=1 Tax=Plakobranchus ocellatus TaxID=259542 RepID=A0AAV3XY87_9GAST|nr:hypothetical protein PoB_000159200 [Plakobranchus ocellatus]